MTRKSSQCTPWPPSLFDFFLFADAFGGTDPEFDLTDDGKVNLFDFFLFADAFGNEAQAKLLALAEEYLGLPIQPVLAQSFPNPFNPETTIGSRHCEFQFG